MNRPTKDNPRKETPLWELPVASTSFSPLVAPRNDQEYCALRKVYKESQKKVQTWLVEINNHTERNNGLSHYRVLADRAWAVGIDMQADVKAELEKTLQGRKLCREYHRRHKHNDDENHDCRIQVFEDIKNIFLQTPPPSQTRYHYGKDDNWRRCRTPLLSPPPSPTRSAPDELELRPRDFSGLLELRSANRVTTPSSPPTRTTQNRRYTTQCENDKQGTAKQWLEGSWHRHWSRPTLEHQLRETQSDGALQGKQKADLMARNWRGAV